MGIRAGLLREFITVQRRTGKMTDSGQVIDENVNVCTVRARVLKQTGNLKEKADELFNYVQITFQIRYREDIKLSDTILYRDNKYKIAHIDYDLYDDRSLKIIAELINE